MHTTFRFTPNNSLDTNIKMLKDEEKLQEGCDDETLNQHTRAIIIGCLLR